MIKNVLKGSQCNAEDVCFLICTDGNLNAFTYWKFIEFYTYEVCSFLSVCYTEIFFFLSFKKVCILQGMLMWGFLSWGDEIDCKWHFDASSIIIFWLVPKAKTFSNQKICYNCLFLLYSFTLIFPWNNLL